MKTMMKVEVSFFATGNEVINFNTIDDVVEFPGGRVFYKRTYYTSPATSVAKTDTSGRGKIFLRY